MRAWAKRMIWFFGLQILYTSEEVLHYWTHNTPYIPSALNAFIWAGLMVIPIILMKDDPEVKRR